MDKLSQLPDEVLARILDFHGVSHQVVALWLCGSSALNVRLSRGGCYRFEAPKNVLTIYRWPSIIFELNKLHTVVVSGLKWMQSMSQVAQGVQKLPNKLKKLELRFPMSHWIFEAKNFTSSFGTSDTTSYKPEPNPRLWDVRSTFPDLEELVMLHRGADMGNHYLLSAAPLPIWNHINPLAVTRFPDSLTKLSWDAKYETDFEALPLGLKSLSLRTQWPSVEALLTLPRGLTFLSGIYVDSTQRLAALPPTLTDAVLWTSSFWFTPEIAASMPRDMSHLYACHITTAFSGPWTAALPSSITCLTLSSLHTLSIKQIAVLPRSLKSIERLVLATSSMREYLDEAEEAHKTPSADFWPPSLTFLSFISPIESLAEIAVLPPTLRVLLGISCVDEPSKILSSSSPEFPATLEKLDIDASFFTTVLTIDRPLPALITSLSCGKIDVSAFPMLPPNLQSLTMDVLLGDITDNSFATLPRYLRTFKFTLPRTAPVPVSAFKSLPRYLESLAMLYYAHVPSIERYFPASISDLTLTLQESKPKPAPSAMYFRD